MDKFIEKLNNLEIDDLTRNNVLTALEVMSDGKRFHIIKTEEYKEYAVLINDQIVIKTKKYDYAGGVAMRNESTVGIKEFVEYIATRSNEIHETQERIRML